MHLQDFPKTII